MARLLRSWRRRSKPERFDAYMRWSLYSMLGAASLFALLAVPGNLQAYGPVLCWVYLAATVLQTGAAIAVLRGTLDRAAGRGRAQRPPLVVLTAATLATLVLVAALPSTVEGPGWSIAGVAVMTNLCTALFALAPQLSRRVAGIGCLAVAAAVGFVELQHDGPGPAILTTLSALLLVASFVLTARVSAWMLEVVWELDEARDVQSRLAVAEERLRFARDLHDTVGRTLSAVAVKSELAAELAGRRHLGAVAQMQEVRQLAQDSLQEMRGVVVGYRTANLDAELDGARSVLRSADVQTRLLGDGTDLPQPAQQVLAWVVREAVTNVLRHAHATRCTIDLTVLDASPGQGNPPTAASRPQDGALALLSITNDGVTAASDSRNGSGLAGLTERLAALDGTLSTRQEADRFTVEAAVPLSSNHEAAAGLSRQHR
jgi:two-component system sensor histidine kinase DesK